MSCKFTGKTAIFGFVLCLCFAGTASAAVRKIKFQNKTGATANDLHIETKQGVTVDFSQTTPFDSERGVNGGTSHNLYNADVANDGEATVRLTSNEETIEITKWWWTKNGNATTNGEVVESEFGFDGGGERKDNGTGILACAGGNASGNGLVRVRINGVNHDFETTPGHTPIQTAAAFKVFLDGLLDGGFGLIHSAQLLDSPHVVFLAGNLLGNSLNELSMTIVAQDSTQDLNFPVPTVSTWGIGTLGLLLLIGATIVLIRRRASVAART